MNIKNYKAGDKIRECIYLKEELRRVLPSGQSKRMAMFKCKCGKEFISMVDNVKRGLATSCGCVQKQRNLEACKTHGLTHTSEFNIWNTMLQRCNNKNNKYYNDYGGRGIEVCLRWHTFINFYNDMGTRPDKSFSLERINNNKGYCKANCKWDTKKNQANNRRNSLNITYNGAMKTLANWARELNMPYNLIRRRIKRNGWSIEEAFTTPLIREKRYLHK